MNLFEKIHNYQMITQLEEAGAYPITNREKAWLTTMLAHPMAAQFFAESTRTKLLGLLHGIEPLQLEACFVEKARATGKHVYHPLVRSLRHVLLAKNQIRLTTQSKEKKLYADQPGIPYKLEYSLVKKVWYLLWLNLQSRHVLTTPLDSILSFEVQPISDDEYDSWLPVLFANMEARKETATIEIMRGYRAELQRILYALSCFEKDVSYDPQTDTYTIQLRYPLDEREYILSKLRFLGKRVKVVENELVRQRMVESARKALGRYMEG